MLTTAPGSPGGAGAGKEIRRVERTLDALEEIFLRDGFRKVTVGELAERLRCSRRTLYEIAATKEDLFLRILDRLLCRIREQGERAAEAKGDLGQRLEAYLAPGITEMARASNTFFADVAGLPPAKRHFADHQRTRIAGIREIVADGVRRGIFRGFDPQLVAEVFTYAYRRVSRPEFLASVNLSATEAYAELSRLLRHGLLHAENGAASPPRRRDASRRRAQSS